MRLFVFVTLMTLTSFGFGQNFLVPNYIPFGAPIDPEISSYDMADLNGDGLVDLLSSVVKDMGTTKAAEIRVAYGPDFNSINSNPDISFLIKNDVGISYTVPFYLSCTDLDNDGDTDIVIGEHSEYGIDASTYIIENQGTPLIPSFVQLFDVNFDPSFVVSIPSTVLFDEDNIEDLLLSGIDGTVAVYRNLGNLNFARVALPTTIFENVGTQISCDDVDLNGTLLCYDKENTIGVYTKENNLYRQKTNTIIGLADQLEVVFVQPRIKDFDQDGKSDLFTSCNSFSAISGFHSDSWLYQGVCVDTMIRPEAPILSSSYVAESSIVSAGEVMNNSEVVFKANELVCLDTTFSVQLGSIFEVIMEGCHN